jgi:hypothetical protein
MALLSSNNITTIQKHLLQHHTTQKLQCTICQTHWSNRRELGAHISHCAGMRESRVIAEQQTEEFNNECNNEDDSIDTDIDDNTEIADTDQPSTVYDQVAIELIVVPLIRTETLRLIRTCDNQSTTYWTPPHCDLYTN